MLLFRKSLTASQYQQPDDLAHVAAKDGEPAIRKAVAAALNAFRSGLDTKRVAAAVLARNWLGAVDVADVGRLTQDMQRAFLDIGSVYLDAAERGATTISTTLRRAALRKDTRTYQGGDPYAFSILTDDAAAELRQYQDDLIGQMTDDVRQFVHQTVIASVRASGTPEEVATAIRDRIGLNDRLATAVQNYRSMLQGGDPGALGRQLRDTSADAEVLAGGLSQKRIDELVDAYAERAVDYRAATIAQTEATRAANLGLHQAYKQAIARGVFPSTAVKRFWRVSLDERTCPVCVAIALSEAAVAGIGVSQAFMSVDGEIENPPVHVSCRCSVEYRTDLDLLPATQSSFGLPEAAPQANVTRDRVIRNAVAGAPDESVVLVDIAKVDAAWAPTGYRIGPEENFKLGRAKTIIMTLAENAAFNAPRLGVSSIEEMGFIDGRHRFAAMRDLGFEVAPVSMDDESIQNATAAGWIVEQ